MAGLHRHEWVAITGETGAWKEFSGESQETWLPPAREQGEGAFKGIARNMPPTPHGSKGKELSGESQETCLPPRTEARGRSFQENHKKHGSHPAREQGEEVEWFGHSPGTSRRTRGGRHRCGRARQRGVHRGSRCRRLTANTCRDWTRRAPDACKRRRRARGHCRRGR